MITYTFWDYDEIRNADCDLTGSDYTDLISFCFALSTRCSLFFPYSLLAYPPVTMRLSKSERELLQNNCVEKQVAKDGEIWYFPCSEEMKAFLLKHYVSVFDWDIGETNPTELSFYRADGNVLFASDPHVGVCTFRLRNGETAEFLRRPGWTESLS